MKESDGWLAVGPRPLRPEDRPFAEMVGKIDKMVVDVFGRTEQPDHEAEDRVLDIGLLSERDFAAFVRGRDFVIPRAAEDVSIARANGAEKMSRREIFRGYDRHRHPAFERLFGGFLAVDRRQQFDLFQAAVPGREFSDIGEHRENGFRSLLQSNDTGVLALRGQRETGRDREDNEHDQRAKNTNEPLHGADVTGRASRGEQKNAEK
jgi:hypothetical protein